MREHLSRWRLLHYAILAAIVVLAFAFIDLRRVARLVLSADPWLVLAILALATADRLLMAWKWWRLLAGLGIEARLTAVIGHYYQASVVSYVPLMAVGSDVLRAYLVIDRHGRTATVLATLVMEKALAVISTCILGLAGLEVLVGSLERGTGRLLTAIVLAGLAASVLVLGLSLYGPLPRHLAGWLRRRPGGGLGAKLGEAIERFHASYTIFGRAPGLMATSLALTIAEHLLQFSMLALAGRAIGVSLPALEFFAVIALVQTVRRVAIYLEGWGVGETASVVLFSAAGLDPAEALTLSLLSNAVAMVAALPGLGLLARSPVRRARGLRGLRGMASEIPLASTASGAAGAAADGGSQAPDDRGAGG
jgi:uncharacterized membrane protein YbhN (UPF0104 family)